MIKGWKKLTKADRKHLSEMKCNDTITFEQFRIEQNRLRGTDNRPLCWECEQIAHKLGMK